MKQEFFLTEDNQQIRQHPKLKKLTILSKNQCTWLDLTGETVCTYQSKVRLSKCADCYQFLFVSL